VLVGVVSLARSTGVVEIEGDADVRAIGASAEVAQLAGEVLRKILCTFRRNLFSAR
jgi:hypothetical protein